MFEGLNRLPATDWEPLLDLPGPSKPIRVEPVEQPGRQPVEVPDEPGPEPEVAPEKDREPVEVPG